MLERILKKVKGWSRQELEAKTGKKVVIVSNPKDALKDLPENNPSTKKRKDKK